MDYRIEDGRIEVPDGYYWRPVGEDERMEVLLQIVVDQDRQLRRVRQRLTEMGG
jgi:hypothetical protein